MSNKVFSLALVGAGGIAYKWVKAISKVKNCSLRLVVDVDINKAELLSKNYKNCEHTDKLNDVLSRLDIDAVIVAVPNSISAKISREIIKSGKHVLCEKPARC